MRDRCEKKQKAAVELSRPVNQEDQYLLIIRPILRIVVSNFKLETQNYSSGLAKNRTSGVESTRILARLSGKSSENNSPLARQHWFIAQEPVPGESRNIEGSNQ